MLKVATARYVHVQLCAKMAEQSRRHPPRLSRITAQDALGRQDSATVQRRSGARFRTSVMVGLHTQPPTSAQQHLPLLDASTAEPALCEVPENGHRDVSERDLCKDHVCLWGRSLGSTPADVGRVSSSACEWLR